ncbi:liver carboxylesterase 1-like protein, partial [Cricetulus griseus]
MWLFALVLASLNTCLAFEVLVLNCMLGHPSSSPVVDTAHGKVLGKYVSLEGFAQPVAIFLGVPFAKPPLGSLRFAPPEPPEPWNFVKNATSYPPMCSQITGVGPVLSDVFTNQLEGVPLEYSEDCLYLNIYSPTDLTTKAKLPLCDSPDLKVVLPIVSKKSMFVWRPDLQMMGYPLSEGKLDQKTATSLLWKSYPLT